MRIVLDTNVYISSIIFKGVCRELFLKTTEVDQCFISPFILQKLSQKLTTKFLFSRELYISFEVDLLKVITLITPQTELPTVCRDIKDNNILQLSESVNAEYLISGDNGLLVLKK